jgi:hypothetical protein
MVRKVTAVVIGVYNHLPLPHAKAEVEENSRRQALPFMEPLGV